MKKKFMLSELFTSYAQFCKCAPGADTSADFDSLQGSATAARKRIVAILGDEVFSVIIELDADNVVRYYLQTAMANLTLATQIAFDAVNRRKNDVNVYKYELEGMKRAYMENFYNSMDSLISELMEPIDDDETEEIKALSSAWLKTRYFTMVTSCKVQNADEFDSIYPIDLSYLFFFRCIPLQKEVLDEEMSGYFDRIDEMGENEQAADETDHFAKVNKKMVSILKLALVKKTVAKALRRFDILEFPVTIRNLFEDNTASRSGSDEATRANNLAQQLDAEVEDLLHQVDMLLEAEDGNSYESLSFDNRPDDNMYMMP